MEKSQSQRLKTISNLQNKYFKVKADLVLKSEGGEVQVNSSRETLSFNFPDLDTTAFFLKTLGLNVFSLIKYLSLTKLTKQTWHINIASKELLSIKSGKILSLDLLSSIKIAFRLLF